MPGVTDAVPVEALVVTRSCIGRVTVLESRVMAAFSVITRPVHDVAAPRPTLVAAMSVPLKTVLAPTVAVDPTLQNTLRGLAPLIRVTAEAGAVVSVVPIWRMKMASGSPPASRVTVPVNWAAASKQWMPGISVSPPRSCPVRSALHSCRPRSMKASMAVSRAATVGGALLA